MMLSTSDVAVWCSRASRNSALRSWSSLKSRTFSMAMTAWSAKVVTSSICFSVNGWTLSPDYDHPNGHTFPEHWNSEYGPETADFLRPGPLIIGVGQNIVNMNRPSLRYDTPGYRLSP